MYKFIGADGQQYGPVNLEQVKRWIVESRLRGETLVQAEGTTEWKPLSAFPELAAELKSTVPPLSNVPPTIGAPSSTANPRASNKIAAGVCGILLGGLGIHKFILGYNTAGIIMLVVTIVTCGWGGIVMHIIAIIEGIIYLTKSDDEFVRTYVDGRKEWF